MEFGSVAKENTLTFKASYNQTANLSVIDKIIIDEVKNNYGMILAGGALRKTIDYKETIKDYDLFFTTENSRDRAVKEFKEKYTIIFECPKKELYTFIVDNKKGKSLKVQLITKRLYSDGYDLISHFDINACCCYYDGTGIGYNDRFIIDVLSKKISINTIEYPVATLNRIFKYLDKGYSLDRDLSLEFVRTIANTDWKDEDFALYLD